MSVEVLRTYRFRCDAYPCTESFDSAECETPEGWTEVSSTAHQRYTDVSGWKPSARLMRAMTANGILTTGRFSLHLCPHHPDAAEALGGHLPHTDGISASRLILACSCGARLGEISGGAKSRWESHFAWFLARAESGAQISVADKPRQTPPIEGDHVT
jgi:hypothetical protein